MDKLLTVEKLGKRFKDRVVLERVSFSVFAGEVLGLIGPNGSGKTTLLECLAGLMPANAGTIRFANQVLAPAHRKEKLFYQYDIVRMSLLLELPKKC